MISLGSALSRSTLEGSNDDMSGGSTEYQGVHAVVTLSPKGSHKNVAMCHKAGTCC